MDAPKDRMPIAIRPASADEAATVLSILVEAAQWLMSRGIRQWAIDDFSLMEVARWQRDGLVLLAWQDAAATGTISIAWQDEELWQTVPPARAGYIHKLAVRRTSAGQGISVGLLSAAEDLIRAQGNTVARLDCWAGNVALRRFYTTAGYTLCQEVTERDGEQQWQCALFEKSLV